MTVVINDTDKPINLWYGHTPHHVPANAETDVDLPERIITEIIKHNDYKDLKVKHAKSREERLTEKKEEVVEVKPWEKDGWDPLSCSLEELKEYSDVAGLVWNEDEDVMRDTIYESLLSDIK